MNLDDLIAAERSAPAEATKTQANQVWQSIEHSFVSVVPAVGAPAAAGKASTLGKLGLGKLSAALSTTVGKVLIATTLVTGGAVGVSRLDTGDRGPPTAESSTAGPENQRTAAAAPVQPTADTLRSAPVPGDAPAQPPTQPATEPQPAAPAPSKEASQSQAEVKPAKARPAAKPKASVQAELALIRRTQSAVRSGSHGRALTLARQHATTYPSGAFVEDREALRALALCESGSAKGSSAASKFHKRWPKSMHRSRIEAACE